MSSLPRHPASLHVRSAAPEIAAFDDADAIPRCFRGRVDLAIWRRRMSAALCDATHKVLASGPPCIDADGGPAEIRAAWAAALRSLDDTGALAADAGLCAGIFAAATGATRLEARLARIDHDACRLFHVDHLTCRLLSTYAGPGTQYLAHADVVREALGRGDNSAIVRPGGTIRELAAGWVGMLRGERSAAMKGRGIVHRSPPLRDAGKSRLVLRIQVAGEITG